EAPLARSSLPARGRARRPGAARRRGAGAGAGGRGEPGAAAVRGGRHLRPPRLSAAGGRGAGLPGGPVPGGREADGADHHHRLRQLLGPDPRPERRALRLPVRAHHRDAGAGGEPAVHRRLPLDRIAVRHPPRLAADPLGGGPARQDDQRQQGHALRAVGDAQRRAAGPQAARLRHAAGRGAGGHPGPGAGQPLGQHGGEVQRQPGA
ncbi:MAG: Histidine ABC transporter, histidine-binding periplasmic protein precursor HisJ, partial [uncultured Acetobacteraceae bacterium]